LSNSNWLAGGRQNLRVASGLRNFQATCRKPRRRDILRIELWRAIFLPRKSEAAEAASPCAQPARNAIQ
jgi:hypothetical protein